VANHNFKKPGEPKDFDFFESENHPSNFRGLIEKVHELFDFVNIEDIEIDETIPASLKKKIRNNSKHIAKLDKPWFNNTDTTGFLVRDDLLLTNWHSFFDTESDKKDWEEQKKINRAKKHARQTKALFGYFNNKCDPDLYELDPETTFICSAKYDYCLISIKGNPGRKWGVIELPEKPHALPNKVIILQHPNGQPQKAVYKNNDLIPRSDSSDYLKYCIKYIADTQSGSSGAPVFDESMRLIALHHSSDRHAEDFSSEVRNEGVLIEYIIEDIKKRDPDIDIKTI